MCISCKCAVSTRLAENAEDVIWSNDLSTDRGEAAGQTGRNRGLPPHRAEMPPGRTTGHEGHGLRVSSSKRAPPAPLAFLGGLPYQEPLQEVAWMSLPIALTTALFATLAVPADGEPTVARSSGGSMKTKHGFGFLNKGSSLEREWVVVNDSALPASITSPTGVKPVSDGRHLRCSAKTTVHVTEAISAIEVRFLTFDVWGNRVRILSASEVVDVPADETYEGDWSWSSFSENEASQFFASIAYVAQVRTHDGRVLRGNVDAVLKEARRFSKEMTEGDLKPKTERKD